MIEVPVAPGELLDKITILKLKAVRIDDPEKRANVTRELALLEEIRAAQVPVTAEVARLEAELHEVNDALWLIEDEIRDHELRSDFGPRFVELARSVYRTNDRRAELKRAINIALGSAIVEEKSYAKY